MKRELKNVMLGCMILAMLGVCNIFFSLAQSESVIYHENKRVPLALENNMMVSLTGVSQLLGLNLDVEENELLVGYGEKEITVDLSDYKYLRNVGSSIEQWRVSLPMLCSDLGIPFSFEDETGIGTIGENIVNAKGIPVLMYHHILPQKDIQGIFINNNIVTSLEDFQQQMQYLYDAGYKTVTLAELMQYVEGNILLDDRTVVITFDDGYLSNYRYAYPVLKQYGYTGVIFLVTEFITDNSEKFNPQAVQYLSWKQVREMGDCFEFASHTHDSHKIGDNGKGILTNMTGQQIIHDLNQSRTKVNFSPYFSYPYGHYNQMVIDILKGQGIEMAFTTEDGYVKPGDNPMTLNRIDVFKHSSFDKFKRVIEGTGK